IPPQPGIDTLNPHLELDRSPFRVSRVARPWPRSREHPPRAAVSSFGFGGTNAHALLEQAPDTPLPPVDHDDLFVVSASTPDLLRTHLRRLAETIEDLSLDAGRTAYTLACRAAFDARVAFVARGRDPLIAALRRHADGVHAGDPAVVVETGD